MTSIPLNKELMKNKTKVLVAMSGGVDSSVAAALHKQKGYDVIGITMDIWPAKADNFGGCCSATAVDDAKSVADKIGIPHYVINYREYFKEAVINNFVEEYRNGRTPNPCIRCNQFIKFSQLFKKADELGAEYISTGHYAIISKDKELYSLKKSVDRTKDQSYFLYGMSQNALKRTLFPVGDMTKNQTREIAQKIGLSVADKKDSQEICFIEDNNYGRFLSDNISEAIIPGPIYDTEGNQIGMHRGIPFYTVGQRKGIGLPFGKPFYVVHIDMDNNSIIVGDEKETFGKSLLAENMIWTSIDQPKKSFSAKAKIRYSTDEHDVKVVPSKNGTIKVSFKKPARSITPGQSVVLYKKDIVLGGGIICKKN